jgi:hypothetical protein
MMYILLYDSPSPKIPPPSSPTQNKQTNKQRGQNKEREEWEKKRKGERKMRKKEKNRKQEQKDLPGTPKHVGSLDGFIGHFIGPNATERFPMQRAIHRAREVGAQVVRVVHNNSNGPQGFIRQRLL